MKVETAVGLGGFPACCPAWEKLLAQRGFVRTEHGFAREGLRARWAGRWLVLLEPNDGEAGVFREHGPEAPGWWKPVMRCGVGHRVFQIPTWLLAAQPAEGEDAGERPDGLAVLDWALATRSGAWPEGWQAPAPEQARRWLPPDMLTLAVGGLVRQGELICQPDRWALRMPLVMSWPDSLPPARRAALRELLADGQSRCALVRFEASDGPAGPTLWGVVDLTGAPHREQICWASLVALRNAIGWLAETAEVLADAAIHIPSLAPGRNQKQPRARGG